MANVYISGTIPNYKLIEEVTKRLTGKYHTVSGPQYNPELTVSTIINADVAIFIMLKKGVFSFINWGDRRNVLVELGIAIGSAALTVVVGNADKLKIIEHPWVRTFSSLQQLFSVIDMTTDLAYIPPTRVNMQEEKERRDREAKL